MQKCLDDNYIFIYSTHNEGKSVVSERFIKNLKGKIYKKLTANDNKFYIEYLNKLVDEYNNSYHCPIVKKSIDADYFALTEKMNRLIKLLNLELVIETELLSIRIFLAKVTPKIGQVK